MRLRKLGHSCLLAEEAGSRFLIDPGCFARGLADLGDLTAVLITHSHEDHLDIGQLQAVLAARPGARVICDEASAVADRSVPAEVVREGYVLELAGVPVSVHGREHAVIHPDLPNVRPRVAVPVHDHGNVFAEWICHLFADLGPAETTVLNLDDHPSTEI